MKLPRLLAASITALALVGCSSGTALEEAPPEVSTPDAATPEAGEVTVTDMVGRTVTLPNRAENAFGAGPPATALLFTFDTNTMAGWNSPVSEAQAHFLSDEAADLPVLGRAFGKDGDFNPETLLAEGVDLIVDAGDLNPSYIDSANELQELTGIPVIQVSTDPADLGQVYELLGTVLGDPERGAELGEEATRIHSQISEVSEAVTEPVSVLYAQGADGLNTAPAGSIHARVIEAIGARNAADGVESPSGRVEVDFEQILGWDPDFVILGPDSPNDPLAQDPTSDANFGTLSAVQEGRVLVAPAQPFGWFDRPPSVNQLLGMMWAASAIYPEHYDGDLAAQVQEFYSVFYHYEMTDEEVAQILSDSGLTP